MKSYEITNSSHLWNFFSGFEGIFQFFRLAVRTNCVPQFCPFYDIVFDDTVGCWLPEFRQLRWLGNEIQLFPVLSHVFITLDKLDIIKSGYILFEDKSEQIL